VSPAQTKKTLGWLSGHGERSGFFDCKELPKLHQLRLEGWSTASNQES